LVSLPSLPVFLFFKFLSGGKLAGGSFSDSTLNKMISLSCGTLIGDIFLHIFPSLMEQDHDHGHDHGHDHDHGHHGHNHDKTLIYLNLLVILGILTFFCLDWHFGYGSGQDHGHDKAHDHDKTHDHVESKSS